MLPAELSQMPARVLSRFPCAPVPMRVKGDPVIAFSAQSVAGRSGAIDCREGNACSIAVYASGPGASCALSVLGAPAAKGAFLPLVDPGATRTVTASLIFDVVVGSGFVVVELANVVGSFTVVCTPYVSPGAQSVQAVV